MSGPGVFNLLLGQRLVDQLDRFTQLMASIGPAPPAARVPPKAGLIRPLFVKPGQTRFKAYDGLGSDSSSFVNMEKQL
jgi:hypothetical protein